jgi:protein phosphatase
LSDGAGGHLGGALAAELSVKAVLGRLQTPGATVDPALLEGAVKEANARVRARRQEDQAVAHMAATLVIAAATAVSDDESSWLVASIGDSRAWIVTGAAARQITDDDNVAAELLRSGSLSPEEALTHPGRHWITRAIGPKEATAAEIAVAQLRPGDALLLASDGLNVLSAGRIHETMTAKTSAQGAAEGLVALALRSGATDNVTVAVLRHVPSSRDADSR